MIKTVVSDGGRSAYAPEEKLDCAVRAIAVVLRESFTYGQVHDVFSWLGRKPKHRSYCAEEALKLFGITLQYSGSTLEQFVSASRNGRFLVHLRGHLSVVENGALIDLGPIGERKIVISCATVS